MTSKIPKEWLLYMEAHGTDVDNFLEEKSKNKQWTEKAKSQLYRVGETVSQEQTPDDIAFQWWCNVEMPRICIDEMTHNEFWNYWKHKPSDDLYILWMKIGQRRMWSQTNHKSFETMIEKPFTSEESRNWRNETHGTAIENNSAEAKYTDPETLKNYFLQKAQETENKKPETNKRKRPEEKQPPNKKPKTSTNAPKPATDIFVTRDENLKWTDGNNSWWMNQTTPEFKWYTTPNPINKIEAGIQTNQRLSKTTLQTDLEINIVLPIQSTVQIWRLVILIYIPKNSKPFAIEDYLVDKEETNNGSWPTAKWSREKDPLIKILYDDTFYKNYDNCSIAAPKAIHIQETIPLNLESQHNDTGPINNQILMYWRTNIKTPGTVDVPTTHLPRFTWRLNFTDRFDT